MLYNNENNVAFNFAPIVSLLFFHLIYSFETNTANKGKRPYIKFFKPAFSGNCLKWVNSFIALI